MIDINKKYTTRDGRPVRILATDLKNEDYPICGTYTDNGEEYVGSWTKDGEYSRNGVVDNRDLIEVKQKKTGWINIYSNDEIHKTSEFVFNNEESAKVLAKTPSYVTTIKIEWEE